MGVSPVIGMVLILAISVLGIVGVTNWGLPAILAMQQNVETRSVLNEFGALDASMQKLIAGTTGQTTFKWQPSIGKGAVDVGPNGERWLVAADVTSTLRVEWESMSNADNHIRMLITGSFPLGSTNAIHAYRWIEGVATEVRVQTASSGCGTQWSPGLSTGTFNLYLVVNSTTSCPNVNLDNIVLSIQLKREDGAVSTYHEAYLADVGRVHWSSVQGTLTHVYHSNGAIFSGGDNRSLVPQSTLSVSPVRTFTNSAGVESLGIFARLLKINGTASFSGVEGGARTSIFLDFTGTWTIGSIDDGDRISIYLFGETRSAVYGELRDVVSGYGFTDASTAGDSVPYVRYTADPAKPFRIAAAYTFVEVQR